MKIINRYILSTFLYNFLLYLTITTILLLLNYLYQIVKSLITHKTEIITIVKLILFLLPTIISITLPVTILISVLLTFSVLNETKELLILCTTGIKKSIYIANFILLSVIISLTTVYLNTNLVPKTYKKFKQIITASVLSKPAVNFTNNIISIHNKKVIVNKIIKQKNNTIYVSNIFIYNPIEKYNTLQTIYAKYAIVTNDIHGNIIFNLYEGNCTTIDKNIPEEIVYIKFGTYQFIIPTSIKKKFVSETITIREMTNNELLQQFKQSSNINYRKNILSEFFLRYTLSISIIVFTITGIFLGLKIKTNAKPLSFIATIFIILTYYFLLTTSISIVENTNITLQFFVIGLIMQLPNIMTLILLITLLNILK